MLRHVALFRWHDHATDEQKQVIRDGLSRLPPLIAELRDYRFGDDVGLVDGSWDFAVVADFDDPDGWRAYQEDPEHQQVREHIRALAAERASVQYEL
ncbi:MAG: Dabb family protein [Actinomycetota bacterium]|nr:Dabb family protein [Actinomycetota bacterium]